MTKNMNLYQASAHALEAAKYLTDIDEDRREALLSIAKELLDCIEIKEEDKANSEEIKKYADKIRGSE